jgi:hypothetical protein
MVASNFRLAVHPDGADQGKPPFTRRNSGIHRMVERALPAAELLYSFLRFFTSE